MVSLTSHSPAETEKAGESLGVLASAGWVIGLSGSLGSGKTRFVKGVARGLGIRAVVQSPTFALVVEYRNGRLPLFHLDLYRLDTTVQILGAGLEEYFSPREGVAVIEWYERWTGPSPIHLCRVHLDHLGEGERCIHYDLPRA
jgi:tRNA threonylcarbamoyladenosine biosynthesis protein TsaE